MGLSNAAQAEIRAELAELDELKRRIDDRAAVLKAVLEPFGLVTPVQPTQQAHADVRPENVIADLRQRFAGQAATYQVQPSPYASTGLRAAILGVLRTHGPSRAPVVAKVLDTVGFQNDSATPLPTRVYNDLWRMSEKGILSNQNGLFALKDEQ